MPGAAGRVWPTIGKGHLHPNPTVIVCLADVVRINGIGRNVDLLRGDVLALAAGVWHQRTPLRSDAAWFGQGILPAWADVVIVAPDVRWNAKLPLQPADRLLRGGVRRQSGNARPLPQAG